MGHFLVPSPPWSSSSLTPDVNNILRQSRLTSSKCSSLVPAKPCLHSQPLLFCSLLDLFSLDHFPQETSASFHFSPNILHTSQALGYFQVEAECNDLST